MKSSLLVALPLALLTSHPATVRASPLEATTYNGQPAFRLSDGKTEAVIVPALGRVMRYGLVGGPNMLWNASAGKLGGGGFQNVGGDKTFIGPHASWELFAPSRWPPQPSWDGQPHSAELLPGGHLRTVGPIWQGFRARIVRDYSLNTDVEFVITSTMERMSGSGDPLALCLWNVSQSAPPDAIFLPLNSGSIYKSGFHWFGPPQDKAAITSEGGLLRIRPTTGTYYKIGLDTPVAALVAVKDGVAWLQRAAKLDGQYPDGAEGAGFPVELYNHGDAGSGQYVELELLSPLRRFRAGSSWTQTVRWSLHSLPGADVNAQNVRDAVTELLNHTA